MNNMIKIIKRPLRPLKKPIYTLEREFYHAIKLKLKLPDFLGIGSGQSGSTWMYKNLSCHPDIFIPKLKEIHYFSRNFNSLSIRHYSSLFHKAGNRVCGEFTPAYNMLLPKRIEYIHKIMPKARLFLIIRNPIERAWSGARRVMSKIAEQENIKFDDINDNEFYSWIDNEWAYRPERGIGGDFVPGILQGHYCKAIENWTTFFPNDQLLVVFFDEIKRDPQGLLCKVFDHIGVTTNIDWEKQPMWTVVNKNPEHEIPTRFFEYLREKYSDEIEELRKRYPSEVKNWRF